MIEIDRCIWCGETIEVDEKYIRETSLYDGLFQDHKWHIKCRDKCDSDHLGEWEYEIERYNNKRG